MKSDILILFQLFKRNSIPAIRFLLFENVSLLCFLVIDVQKHLFTCCLLVVADHLLFIVRCKIACSFLQIHSSFLTCQKICHYSSKKLLVAKFTCYLLEQSLVTYYKICCLENHLLQNLPVTLYRHLK